MRGGDGRQTATFSYIAPERRVPKEHPLRPILERTDEALRQMSVRFSELYSSIVRPSIPPVKLLRALLLQILYTVRIERLLMEHPEYNLLCRCFVLLSRDGEVRDQSML